MSAVSAVGVSAAQGGETIVPRDPATGAALGSVPVCDPPDVPAVVASVAVVQPLWGLLRTDDRARYLRRAAQALIDERDALIETIAREQGRTSAEVAALEVLPALEALRWAATGGVRALSLGRVPALRSGLLHRRARIACEPLGVVGVIGAGGAPFAQPLGQIASALVAGNAVVFKPAPRAALAGEAIGRVLARASLPEGLVRVVHGAADTGAALARSPVSLLAFTGSAAVASAVAQARGSAETAIAAAGKDAMIVLDDANVALAARCALSAACAGAGQARGALGRVYVSRERYEHLLERLVQHARSVRVGNPRDPGVHVGPLASCARLHRAEEQLADALADGARLLCGGPVARRAGSAGPAYFAPAILADAGASMTLVREPPPAPVIAVSAVDSIDEALARAGEGAEQPAAASVWGGDRYRALRVARELRARAVWVNDHLPASAASPFADVPAALPRAAALRPGLRQLAREKLVTAGPAPLGSALWWGPWEQRHERAARALVLLRSGRRSDRKRALREGARVLLPLGAEALRRR
jgi:acyl-CoA reductase-like NAD-dependent aldehyde dehydrogenase